jgi:nucleotide-binding universal stress UspA family protein
VPLDGSAVAESVLPFVEEVARLFGASLVLFHAVAPLTAYPGFETVQPRYIGEALDEMQDQARQFLTRVAKGVESRGLQVSMIATIDIAADGIVSAAKEVGADLIAIGTHGRSGIGRAVMGSVADAVVRRATLPCLLVNPARTQSA